MAPKQSSELQLSEHEEMYSNDKGRCYIFFGRKNEKFPNKSYKQLDALPYAASDATHNDTRYYVSPAAAPIPTVLPPQDQNKSWIRDESSITWTRGTTIWKGPYLILRIFSHTGEYIRQLHFGSNWKQFDKMAAKFDPNDPEIARKYNVWLEYIMTTYQTNGQGREDDNDEDNEVPWNAVEIYVLRTFVNDYIRANGLVAFASNLNWERKVPDFNVRSRQAEADAPWRDEASILKMFAKDVPIREAFQKAKAMERRIRGGEQVGWEAQRPRDFVDVREGLDEEME
jgi:hypothetical protein